jgi:hypothetical protein
MNKTNVKIILILLGKVFGTFFGKVFIKPWKYFMQDKNVQKVVYKELN